MRPVDAGPRRWLAPVATGLFVGGPCLLLALTGLNVLRWSEAADAAESARGRVAQIEQRIRTGASARMTAAVDTSAIFLAAAGADLARAELQRHLVGMIERAGGRLIESRIEDDPAGAQTRDIVLRVSFDAANDGLLDLVAAMEGGVPFLTVEALAVRPVPDRAAAADDETPLLRAALTVRGHRREERP